jgi:predicted nucleic acid-binding protein
MFRNGTYKSELKNFIEADQLCIHPFLVAELALGSLPDRTHTLHFLDQLIQLRPVRLADVRILIESRKLASSGIGLTDAHLIASCLASPGVNLWTIDKKLGNVAESLGIRTVP